MKYMDWNFFLAQTPSHYPLNKLKKHSPARHEGPEDTATARPRVRSYSRSLIDQLRLSLGPKGLRRLSRLSRDPDIAIHSPSVLSFKAIRYPLDPPKRPDRDRDAPVPELRHLRKPHPGVPQRRATEPVYAGSSRRSANVAARARRSAKTPVFSIGDLERAHSMRDSLLVRREEEKQDRPRGSDGPPPSRPRPRSHPSLRRQKSHRSLRALVVRREQRMSDPNLGLQICLELLTEELSKGTEGLHGQGLGTDATKLKILLMIEAYERLQDQLVRCGRDVAGGEDMRGSGSMRAMFDVWIEALERLYDGLDDVSSQELG
ncbi:hypothetical protein NKR19_g3827 [Coniochaeta hoffmannii]|uniref:Mating-type switching protein swi10 n=1 Tax=Coniochaeta hoffmannii TaxID=91930 RepID=A0AA38S6L0_9PEZI|nr:hypothetical protein NKR19_g3827 [Coniochaeta hoffmannii]